MTSEECYRFFDKWLAETWDAFCRYGEIDPSYRWAYEEVCNMFDAWGTEC